MVARPPVAVVVDRMTVADLDAVHVIEREAFSTPWPAHAYQQELETNRLAHYIVARWGAEIVGFAGMWLLVDEAHVTTFATRGTWRRQGIGERLLLALLDLAKARGAHEATLEVRPSNTAARRLYEKYGFRTVGLRPRYYSDNHEDALIMTTEPLEGRSMHDRLVALRSELAERPEILVDPNGRPIARTSESGSPAERSHADGSRRPAGGVGAASTDSTSIPDPGAPRTIQPSRITRRPS
jgi:ribosomal-protein-alanine N-acetyltransferase